MVGQCVLGDGQPQTCAAVFAAAAGIDTVKAVGQIRQVFGGNAFAFVAHAEFGQRHFVGVRVVHLPQGDVDGARFGIVAHRVKRQIGQCLIQLAFSPRHPNIGRDIRRHRVPSGGQVPRVLHDLFGHSAQVAGCFRRVLLLRVFQCGQRHQIVHQMAHPRAVVLHQADELLLLFWRQVRVFGQRFQKAVNHGQRRAQFVRYIGDKSRARGLQLLGAADVFADDEFGVAREADADKAQVAQQAVVLPQRKAHFLRRTVGSSLQKGAAVGVLDMFVQRAAQHVFG